MSEYILLHAISLKGSSWTFFNSAVVELGFKRTEFHTSGALFVRKRIKSKLYLKIMSQTVIYSKITHIYNSLFRDTILICIQNILTFFIYYVILLYYTIQVKYSMNKLHSGLQTLTSTCCK